MSDALLPCPFCGGETKGEWGGACSDNPYVITCPGCPATMIAYGESDHAIAAWNRRATPAEVDALRARVERLEAALRECADDLEAYVMREYSGEVLTRGNALRRARDLAPVDAARAALEDRP